MSGISNRQWVAESLWWIITAIIVVLIILPIVLYTPDYRFILSNILFVIAAVTWTRYIFLWSTHPLARNRPFRYVLLVICIPTIIYSIGALNDFQIFVDDYGLTPFVEHLHLDRQRSMTKYIKNEYVFFGVACVISSLALPIRLLISKWRQRNSTRV